MQNELRVFRAKRRLNQYAVAKAAGFTSRDRYWRIENDHAEPTDDEIDALVRVLEAPREVLFPPLAESQAVGQ